MINHFFYLNLNQFGHQDQILNFGRKKVVRGLSHVGKPKNKLKFDVMFDVMFDV